jgi:hypothetical protein
MPPTRRLEPILLPGKTTSEQPKQLAPPASHNAKLEPVVEGPAITLTARHAKVRRDGYAK